MTQDGRRRAVITGLGALTPVGNDAPTTWAALVSGCSGIGPVTLFDASPYPSRIAGEIKNFRPEDHVDAKEARRIARASLLAIAAGREAVADAGLDWAQQSRERAGVILGTGMGCVELLVEPIFRLKETGVARTTPFVALGSLSNMPAFHLGIDNGCQGPMSTIITACASGAQAIGEAVEWIRRGASDIVLAGGVEAQVNAIFFGGFCSPRNVSIRN